MGGRKSHHLGQPTLYDRLARIIGRNGATGCTTEFLCRRLNTSPGVIAQIAMGLIADGRIHRTDHAYIWGPKVDDDDLEEAA